MSTLIRKTADVNFIHIYGKMRPYGDAQEELYGMLPKLRHRLECISGITLGKYVRTVGLDTVLFLSTRTGLVGRWAEATWDVFVGDDDILCLRPEKNASETKSVYTILYRSFNLIPKYTSFTYLCASKGPLHVYRQGRLYLANNTDVQGWIYLKRVI